MKATTKKLLCLLAVLTLALSLAVPAAAATEPPSTCPACGATNIVWMALESKLGDANLATPSALHTHYYLTEDTVFEGMNAITTNTVAGNTVCVYFGGFTITQNGRNRANSNGTLNLIGPGKMVRSNSADTNQMFVMGSNGQLNCYGKITLENQDPDVPMFKIVVGNKFLFEDTTIKTKTFGLLPATTSTPPVATIKGGNYEIETLFTWDAGWETADPEKQAKINFDVTGGTFNFEPKADLGKGNTITIPEGYEVTSASGKWTVAAKAAPAPTPSNPKPSNPSTADNSALLLWTVLAITSGAALTIASKKRAVK